MEIISQKMIKDPFDILELNIIDFNRLNGSWNNQGDALKTIFSWFKNTAMVTRIKVDDFRNAPVLDNWPGWEHAGYHEKIGQLYWNWFYCNHPGGEIHFSDSPDFWGLMPPYEGKRARIHGDIGKVSASAFSFSQKFMRINDIWISVLDNGEEHVVIESFMDIYRVVTEGIRKNGYITDPPNTTKAAISKVYQLSFF